MHGDLNKLGNNNTTDDAMNIPGQFLSYDFCISAGIPDNIPGKKIGVTCNLNNRVTLQQGYLPNEYEVLEVSDDVDYISEKEIQLQKHSVHAITYRHVQILYTVQI